MAPTKVMPILYFGAFALVVLSIATQHWWLVIPTGLLVAVWGAIVAADLGGVAQDITTTGQGRIRAPDGVSAGLVRFVAGGIGFGGGCLVVIVLASQWP